MSSLVSTLLQVLRGLRRRPGFALVSITTIALAIGANTAIWSVVSGTLLRPLPFRQPERLVSLDARAHTGFTISLSIRNFRDWRDRSRIFESFAASAPWDLRLTGRGPAQIVRGRALVGDLFGTLGGLQPAAGRLFAPGELPDHEGGERVVVLGHSFWQQRFGGDPEIVGQTLTLGQRPHTVIGVLPPDAGYPGPNVEVYLPMAALGGIPWEDRESGFGASAIARLRPGVSLESARRDLERVNREVRELVGATAVKAEVGTLAAFFVGDVKKQLWTLMGAVGFVLLIAVANVGNLFLARGEDRHRELTVRAALGAERIRLVRLLVAEALLIAGLGGVIGAGLAVLALEAIVPLLPTEIPAIVRGRIGVDASVLGFGIGLALLTGLVFGLVPALRSTRVDLAGALKSGGRTSDPGRGGLRSALVVVEVALALVLLVSAGLMLKGLDRLLHVDKGFDEVNVLSGAIGMGSGAAGTPERWRAFYGGLQQRMAALPGVAAAAFALLLPLSQRSWELRVHKDGVPVLRETGESVLYNAITPEYFDAFGVSIVRGRGFTGADREGAAPVAIIDETMAAKFWPGEDPIGKRVTFDEEPGQAPEGAPRTPRYRTVVGITRNVRHYELVQPSRIQAYVPIEQSGTRWGMTLRFGIRTTGNPAGVAPPLRALVSEIDPDAVLYQVEPLSTYVNRATARNRAMTRVLLGFAAGALGLAALGIFGVMTYAVARRAREIGIRVALGATPRDVMRWVGWRAVRLTLFGLGLGLAGAAGLTRVLGSALFEVSPLDPPTYVLVTGLLGFTALLAAWLPARKAAAVDPVKVLGEEG